ncbi:UNVERIFIED_CONTAM: putative UDP-rhamnose:rhamnosyltransferase 1 [Sesamum latifolium]|uniref:UDP-rhamnose:rhamnosyltransferase 1 n=1 Tax=Sesamum latifolium TaxID=2727402 RepID=A0AAW2UJZ0_9LAMI
MIPYLQLSKHIAQKGHRISFISTPRNIDRLPELPLQLSSSIALVKIPLPRTDELPENAEATMDIHGGQTDDLKKAFDGLEPGLTCFLDHLRLCCTLVASCRRQAWHFQGLLLDHQRLVFSLLRRSRHLDQRLRLPDQARRLHGPPKMDQVRDQGGLSTL